MSRGSIFTAASENVSRHISSLDTMFQSPKVEIFNKSCLEIRRHKGSTLSLVGARAERRGFAAVGFLSCSIPARLERSEGSVFEFRGIVEELRESCVWRALASREHEQLNGRCPLEDTDSSEEAASVSDNRTLRQVETSSRKLVW